MSARDASSAPRRGVPTAQELVEAVRDALRQDVLPAAGEAAFQVRVAITALSTVARELEGGLAFDARHAERLRSLGATDDADLAAQIREGGHDGDLPRLVAVLRTDAVERLAIDNPRHLLPEDAAALGAAR